MLSWHGCVSRHGPAISTVTVAIRSVSLEVQLLGHPSHRLQGLGLLLLSQLLHRQESGTEFNFNICLSWINSNANTICKPKVSFIDNLGQRKVG